MATPLLITRSDFAGKVELASNMIDAKINNRILEAEDFDLLGLMGNAFYYWFVAQTQLEDVADAITKLLDGTDYLVNNITHHCDGIKPVLVYYATSRLIKNLDIHFTPNGVMQKKNEFSDHVDPKDLSWRSNQFVNQGLAYWEKCVKYLDANKTLYPLWKPDCGTESRSSATAAKFSSLGACDNEQGYGYPYINRF